MSPVQRETPGGAGRTGLRSGAACCDSVRGRRPRAGPADLAARPPLGQRPAVHGPDENRGEFALRGALDEIVDELFLLFDVEAAPGVAADLDVQARPARLDREFHRRSVQVTDLELPGMGAEPLRQLDRYEPETQRQREYGGKKASSAGPRAREFGRHDRLVVESRGIQPVHFIGIVVFGRIGRPLDRPHGAFDDRCLDLRQVDRDAAKLREAGCSMILLPFADAAKEAIDELSASELTEQHGESQDRTSSEQ